MFEYIFADPTTLLMGAVTGLIFGFLLQRGGVTRYNVILGQFLLKDFTVLKVMGTAVVVGAVGIYSMRAMGAGFDMHIKSATLLGNAVGGVLFGIGMAIFGYCPGTGVAALGDGSRHAIPGVLGMLVGAATYAEVYPWVKTNVLSIGAFGDVTIDAAAGLSPWWLIVALMVIAAGGFYALERWEHRRPLIAPAAGSSASHV